MIIALNDVIIAFVLVCVCSCFMSCKDQRKKPTYVKTEVNQRVKLTCGTEDVLLKHDSNQLDIGEGIPEKTSLHPTMDLSGYNCDYASMYRNDGWTGFLCYSEHSGSNNEEVVIIEYSSADIKRRTVDSIGDIYDVARSDDGTVCLAYRDKIVRINDTGQVHEEIDAAGLHPFQYLDCADDFIIYSAVDKIELPHWSFWSKQDALSDSENFLDGVTGIHVRTNGDDCVISYGNYLPLYYSKKDNMLTLLARGEISLKETCGLSVNMAHSDKIIDDTIQLVDCSITSCPNNSRAICSYNDESLNSHWFVWDRELVLLEMVTEYDAYGKDWILCDDRVIINDSIYRYEKKGRVELLSNVSGGRLALDANDELISWRYNGIYFEENSHRIISW